MLSPHCKDVILYAIALILPNVIGTGTTSASLWPAIALYSGIFALLARDSKRYALKNVFSIPSPAWTAVILAALLAFSSILSLIGGAFSLPSGSGAHTSFRLDIFLSVVLIAPAWEELYFRVHIMGCLEKRGTAGWVIVVFQGLLFALGHGYQGSFALVQVALLGMILGIARWKGRSWSELALAHGLYNGFVYLGTVA